MHMAHGGHRQKQHRQKPKNVNWKWNSREPKWKLEICIEMNLQELSHHTIRSTCFKRICIRRLH